jgi:hypothetical protein
MIDTLKPLIKQFMPFAQERMGFKRPPRLFLKQDSNNAANPLGKTAFYDPQAQSVTLYVTNRHPKDVMRSLSHELVHHTQNCNGDFEDAGEMGEGYTQNNPHMREMERQAYEMGNLCFRDWEDGIKGTIYFEHLQKGVEKDMSTKDWKNGEIKTLLTEQWGFSFNLDHLNEDYTLPGGGGEDSQPTGDPEDEEKAGKEETSGTVKEAEVEEAYAGAKQKDRPRQARGMRKCYDDEGNRTECLEEKAAFKRGDETEKGGAAFTGETEEEREEKGRISEDSGEDEAWHQWKNEHADDDHIKEIEHHLRALKDDRDYERHEAEYDHDEYEDKGMEEGGSGRKDPVRMQSRDVARDSDDRKRPMEEAQLRAMVREALKKVKFKSNKGK